MVRKPVREVQKDISFVNNAEFNAKVYYDSNPDLQTAIGADAQALYNHWVQYGKAEGRKAK
ncbi:MAG: hypothetical protein E7305_06435 [Butyrivibrio sp.]|nr:hypothetical protein [Butyrivibrio sp.]